MKAISIWQPYASLIIHGHKVVETRGWAAPKSIIGQTIAIASTANIKREQRDAYNDEEFQYFYKDTGLPDLENLPCGYALGTAMIVGCDLITESLVEDVSLEELSYGWWDYGRYAWHLSQARPFPEPIRCKGNQGIWEWDVFDDLNQEGSGKTRPKDIRHHLRVV
jgi:hypothetical protein